MKASLVVLIASLAATNIAGATGYQDFNLGILARNRDDDLAAVSAFTLALNDADLPGHLRAVAYFDRGDAYLGQKGYDAAIVDFTSALALKQDFIDAYIERGKAFRAENKLTQAADDDTSAVRINPDNLNAYGERILSYAAMGDFEKQFADCATMLQKWPKESSVLLIRSEVYLRQGKYDAASSDADAALGFNSGYADAFGMRGKIRELKGDVDGALEDFDDEIVHDPDSEEAQLSKGFAQWNLRQFDRATETFADVLMAEPSSTLAVLGLAISKAKFESDRDEPLESYSGSVDLRNWPGALVGLYLGKLTPDQLRTAAERDSQISPASRRCQMNFYLGEWLLTRGDIEAAKASLTSASQSCPPDQIELRLALVELSRLAAGKS